MSDEQARTNEDFIADPTGYVLAVVDDVKEAAAIERLLRDEHFEDVRLYVGSGGADAIDSEGTAHGASERAVRGVQRALTNKDNLAEYEGALAEGSAVIAFLAPDNERRDAAVQLLSEHGARTINAFGTAVVTTLKP